jgi:hypothetical protein
MHLLHCKFPLRQESYHSLSIYTYIHTYIYIYISDNKDKQLSQQARYNGLGRRTKFEQVAQLAKTGLSLISHQENANQKPQ